MKILLINPSQYNNTGDTLKFKYGTIPPLNLLTIAGLINQKFPQVKITIIDEFIDDIPFSDDYDLVGITTTFTCTFPRVIDISKKFRSLGVPVVLGGTHATCDRDYALQYSDSIVTGEAENNVENLVEDLLSGRPLKKVYENDDLRSFENSRAYLPAYELIDLSRYFQMGLVKKSNYFTIETSRGCPMNCNYCTVRMTHGRKVRFRPVADVIREIQYIKKFYNGRYFNITDDNFFVNTDYYTELLNELKKEKINYFCQISTRIIDKSDKLALLKESGCVSAFIGFESVSKKSLDSVKKWHNKVSEYKDICSSFNQNNIPISAGFMFGMDNDDEDTFGSVKDFINNVKVQRCVFNILTPFPGTEIYDQFVKEGRIIEQNYTFYDGIHVVFKPKNFSIDQLENSFWQTYRDVYSSRSIFRRVLKNDWRKIVYTLALNLRFRHHILQKTSPCNSGKFLMND